MKKIFSLLLALCWLSAIGQSPIVSIQKGTIIQKPLCKSFKVNIEKISKARDCDRCCYSVTIINNYTGPLTLRPRSFRITVAKASVVSESGTPVGWNKDHNVSPPGADMITWTKIAGYIPNGRTNLSKICFDNIKNDPFFIKYEWLNGQGIVICRDSIQTECDTSTVDKSGCDVDIDTTLVTVGCGGNVNVKPIFDGTPSSITYTIYDTSGNVILTASNIPDYTFTLPGTGIYYGIVKASCGGGEGNGGDEDEEAFEIINSAPVADFSLKSKCACSGGVATRIISTTDNSQEDGILTYSWAIKDIATGIITTYNIPEPSYNLLAKKQYNVELTVKDSKGCSAYKTMLVQEVATCNAKYDWWYSWCETCKDTGHANVTVNFENLSQFANCSAGAKYSWDFGDGGTSTLADPIHTYKKIPCQGTSFTVKLVLTLGNPGDKDYCTSSWDTTITISNQKSIVGVSRICCDGLVFFYTDATKGKWSTPGSLGIPKWPAVSKKIWKPLGIQIGQNYRQYYSNPGTYYVTVSGSETIDHNRCPAQEVKFTIDKVECFNRNVKRIGTANVGGVNVKYKFRAIALPFIHRMKSKIKTIGFKKVAEISTDFTGEINKKGADGCFCDPVSISATSGLVTNRRKANAATTTSGKFRIAEDKATANFYIKTKSGATGNYELKLGFPPCDHPWFMFF